MKRCGIYGIKNVANGKWYVGQSLDIDARIAYHFGKLRNRNHFNKHLQMAFNLYGESNFEVHILEELSENLLDIREISWIEYHKSSDRYFGYNVDVGGHNPKGIPKSEEHKRKISATLTGRKLSEDHRRKISLSNKGKKHKPYIHKLHTEEYKKAMSIVHSGKQVSETTKNRMSISAKRAWEKRKENVI
jgi:group I intron endonuclease